MPLVRCRYYDDSGAPLGRGCKKGPDCNFVHPSSPQWSSAPKPRTLFGASAPPYARAREDRSRDSGWDRDRDRRADGGSVDRDRGRGDGGRGDRSPNAAGPSSASRDTSGWGTGSFGGSGWGDTSGGTGNAAGAGAAHNSGWGAPPTSVPNASSILDWGAPTSAADWGAPPPPTNEPPVPPPPGSWGDWGANQQSPNREKQAAETESWGDTSKGTNTSVASMPQGDFAPRTPRSPQRSPQRERVQAVDPRRRPPTTASATSKPAAPATTPSDEAAQAVLAKETRKEEMRTLSWGVPAPVALAGPSGSSSSAKPNPFAFPEYTPAERMDVEPKGAKDTSREVNMAESEDPSRIGSRAPSRAATPAAVTTPEEEHVPSTLAQWKSFTRALTKAVALDIELGALNEIRAKQRTMQRSAQFRSASMTTAHNTINEVRTEHEAKIRRAQRKLDEYVDRLARLPADGPPATTDRGEPQEYKSVREWVAEISPWVDSARAYVRDVEERERALARALEEKQEAERAEAEARAAAWEAARVRIASVAGQAQGLEETMTDLEHRIEELQLSDMKVGEVVVKVVGQLEQELGVCLLARETSQASVEDGEVRADPPPRKTESELAEDCARLEREMASCIERLGRVLSQIEEQKTRNATKDSLYHQLAKDRADMQIALDELSKKQEASSEAIQKNREELDKLRRALETCREQEPPLPPPPMAFDELAEHILPLLRPELRGTLQEGLGAMRRGVDLALQKQQEDICLQVYTAFRPAMQIIQSVKNLNEHQPELIMPPPPPPMQSVQHS